MPHTHSSEHPVTCLHACDRVIFLCTVDLFGILCAFVFAHSHAQARIMCVVVWVCFLEFFFCGVVCGVLLLFSVLVKTYAIQCMHTNTHAHTARTAAMHIAQQVVHPRPSVGAGRPAGLPQRIHSHTRTDAYNQPVRRESRSCQRSRASRNRHSHTHTKSLL